MKNFWCKIGFHDWHIFNWTLGLWVKPDYGLSIDQYVHGVRMFSKYEDKVCLKCGKKVYKCTFAHNQCKNVKEILEIEAQKREEKAKELWEKQ
jgi:hypothetical protein